MDQPSDMEEVSNNETETTQIPFASPPAKPDIDCDSPVSPRNDSAVIESNDKFKEETSTTTEETKEVKDLGSDNVESDELEAEKKDDVPEGPPSDVKSENWQLKLEIYSSTSSSSHEDSEPEEQKESSMKPNSERSIESPEMSQEIPESEDPDKSDAESEFLGFETHPDPSSVTAIYQKLIAKSEAAVDIDKWSSCSGSGSPPFSDYNSDDGDPFNQSPRSRDRYYPYSERDEDETAGSTRNSYESMSHEGIGGSSYIPPETLKFLPTSKRKGDACSSTPTKGRRQVVDVNNPAFKVPFTLGWKREVVFRSTVDGGANNKRLADIYYYTPTGKKMRSSREIMEYLEETHSPLSVENFTFLKDCVNPDDPSLEIIREAKKIAVKEDGSRSRKSRSKSSTPTMGSPEWSSESTSPMKGIPQHGCQSRTKRKIFTPQGVTSGEVGIYSPPWSNNATATNGSPRYATDSRNWIESTKRNSNVTMPCSLRCLGLYGVVPTLQCRLCVCLYHPECVGGIPMNMDSSSYICKNCDREAKENHLEDSSQSSKRTTPPPLVPIEKLGKNSPTHRYSPTDPPRLQRFPQNQLHPDMQGHGDGSACVRRKSSMFTGQSVALMQGRKYVVVRKVTFSVLPRAATAAAAAVAAYRDGTLSKGSVVPISKESLYLQHGTKPSTVKVTGGTFHPPTMESSVTSQSSGGESADLCTGLGQEMQEKKPQSILVSSPVQTDISVSNQDDSTFTSLPLNEEPLEKEFTKRTKSDLEASRKRKLAAFAVEPDAKRLRTSESNRITPVDHQSMESSEDTSLSDDMRNGVAADSKEAVPVERKNMFAQDFMNSLSSAYSSMLHVFHYLNVQDLLRAAMVCRMWRDLAGGHPSLWRTVRMKNSQVVDWVGFAETLARNRTEVLDLRKMLLPTSAPTPSEDGSSKTKDRRNQWGQEFCRAIHKTSGTLRRLDLCRCGMDVLEGVASACPNLTALCALAIRSQNLNLDFVGKITNLQELRLKSPNGMNLVGDLSELSKLTFLKHLSLTTVRDLVGDEGERLSFLSSLNHLESLELGECASFGEVACDAFTSLIHLVRLRLERGQVGEKLGNIVPENEEEQKGLLVALSKLPALTQLELVNFDIGSGFDQSLAKCTSLKRLLIIPTYVAQSATSNHLVMSGAIKLSGSLVNFTWGVTHEVLQAIELFVASDNASVNKEENGSSGEEQDEGKRMSKGKSLPSSECLPILKPLPSASNESEEKAEEEEDSESDNFSRVEFVPLSRLHGILSAAMPSTKVQIVKMPFSATWRQGMSEVDL